MTHAPEIGARKKELIYGASFWSVGLRLSHNFRLNRAWSMEKLFLRGKSTYLWNGARKRRS